MATTNKFGFPVRTSVHLGREDREVVHTSMDVVGLGHPYNPNFYDASRIHPESVTSRAPLSGNALLSLTGVSSFPVGVSFEAVHSHREFAGLDPMPSPKALWQLQDY